MHDTSQIQVDGPHPAPYNTVSMSPRLALPSKSASLRHPGYRRSLQCATVEESTYVRSQHWKCDLVLDPVCPQLVSRLCAMPPDEIDRRKNARPEIPSSCTFVAFPLLSDTCAMFGHHRARPRFVQDGGDNFWRYILHAVHRLVEQDVDRESWISDHSDCRQQ